MCNTNVMTQLQSFIAETGGTHQEWANRLGISRSHMTTILNGQRAPGKDLMVKIEAETNGAVPILSWFASSNSPHASGSL